MPSPSPLNVLQVTQNIIIIIIIVVVVVVGVVVF